MNFTCKDKKNKKNAYVIFTREPVPGSTKTRLMPYYTADQCAELHRCFLRDISEEMKNRDFDVIVSYTGGEPVSLQEIFGRKVKYIQQRGDGLGQRMENAVSDVLRMGYEKVVLTGSDIPELEADTIETAFAMLGSSDVVIGPTEDGGYYLIGMSSLHHEAFNAKVYGVSSVFEETVSSIREKGLAVEAVDEYSDIDTKNDIAEFRRRITEDPTLRRTHSGRFVMENLKVSVIIPVYNEEAVAGLLKKQLMNCLHGRNDTEIIFVDGGSNDNTLSVLGNDFRVLSSKKGRGVQMNTGAMKSNGDVLFFLHCDSVLPDDFVDEIKHCMMSHDFGCFGIRFSSRNIFMITNRIISNHRAFIRGLPFGDQGIFIDRDLFFESGMFPEIPLMEDYEFSMRLKRYGIRPGMTCRRILTSSRRYGMNTKEILETEFRMWNLRRQYRRGRDIEELAGMYKDVR
ncbi:MAG: TIGR04283 family arsenosugar biosynthesis glycosyltransferase [Mogibacterium sp.]|nr:TIGR04283 family arsenosugar biosynthesis glycosyltransferase [Mogibacterium sp.]